MRVAAEAVLPRFAGDGADLAGGHLDGEGIGGLPVRQVVTFKPQPQGFGLPHGEQHAAALEPGGGHARREVVDVPQREGAQAGR